MAARITPIKAPQTNRELPKIGASRRLPRISKAMTTAPVANAVAMSQNRGHRPENFGLFIVEDMVLEGSRLTHGRAQRLHGSPVLEVAQQIPHRYHADDQAVLGDGKMADPVLGHHVAGVVGGTIDFD